MQSKVFSRIESNIVDYLGFIDPDKYNVDTIKTVTIQVTNKCNLACTYCYQHNKNDCMLSFDTAKKFIDDLLANKYKQFFDVDIVEYVIFDFIGGEPFIAIDLMEQLTEYIEIKLVTENSKYINNHMYSISTNGTLYFTNKVQKYLDTYQGFVSVSVTIDGNKDVHDACRIYADDGRGSYDDAHAAAIAVKERYSEKGTKITLAPANLDHLAESFKYFYGEGYTSIHMNCVYEDVWNNVEDIRKLYKQTKTIADWLIASELNIFCNFFDNNYTHITEETENWCGGVGNMISIAPGGNIYPCQRYAEISIPTETRKPFKLGTVEKGILSNKDEEEVLNSICNVTAWSCSDDECRHCPIASSCGYCSAYNYEVYGTVNKRTKFTCNPHRVRYLVSYHYYWQARLQNKNISWGSEPMGKELKLTKDLIEDLLGKDECAYLFDLERKVKSFED